MIKFIQKSQITNETIFEPLKITKTNKIYFSTIYVANIFTFHPVSFSILIHLILIKLKFLHERVTEFRIQRVPPT